MTRHVKIGTTFVVVLAGLGAAQALLDRTAGAERSVQAPRYEVDPMWLRPLPNHWVLASTIGVGIDAQDHV